MQLFDLETHAQNGRFYLVQMPDLHADHKSFDQESFIKWQNVVLDLHKRDEGVIIIGQGDYVHGRLPGDKLFDSSVLRGDTLNNLEDYVNYMAQRVAGLIRPFIDCKIPTVLIRGNHDAYIKNVDIVGLIAKFSGASNGGPESLVRVTARDQHGKTRVKTLYAAHGHWGGNAGSLIQRARGIVHTAEADAYLFGHGHTAALHIENIPYLKTRGDLLLQTKERLFSFTSSFVKSREVGVADYPSAKSLSAVDESKYIVGVDTWNDKFLPSRVL